MVDATKRPIKIPPEFSTYAEKHGVFEMYKDMMQELLIQRPENPIAYLIDYLSKDNHDLPAIIVLGPPAAGKCTISRLIASKTRAIYLTPDNILQDVSESLNAAAHNCLDAGKDIPDDLWVKIIVDRLNVFDVVRRGYVMDGFPETREQAIALQEAGISPSHCVLLEAPDTVLIERAAGKRVDSETGDVYHTTFDWPSNPELQSRLDIVPDYTSKNIRSQLEVFHRNIPGLKECFKSVLKEVNADQPKPDVFAQVHMFLSTKVRSAAPFTPRILLLGPSGAGKGVQAALLANKYDIVNVSCGHLVKEAMVNDSKTGKAIKTYVDKGMMAPDNFILELIQERLNKNDCDIKGWVLHGFPMNTDQASQLRSIGYEPNRVFFIEVPNDSIIERLLLRMTDPITGDRYHLLYNPPRIAEIRDRLERHPNDEEAEVRNRLKHYHTYKEELEDYYPDGLHINGDQDPHTVFETIESMTVNRLPIHFDR